MKRISDVRYYFCYALLLLFLSQRNSLKWLYLLKNIAKFNMICNSPEMDLVVVCPRGCLGKPWLALGPPCTTNDKAWWGEGATCRTVNTFNTYWPSTCFSDTFKWQLSYEPYLYQQDKYLTQAPIVHFFIEVMPEKEKKKKDYLGYINLTHSNKTESSISVPPRRLVWHWPPL